jgi:hypothetical protein
MSSNERNETNETNETNENFIVTCPNCSFSIIIEKINCSIFRHAVFISNGEQVPPHLNKEECEILIKKKLIYGCCKPFRLIKNNNKYQAVICDYI